MGDDVAQISQRLFDRPDDAPEQVAETLVGMTEVAPGDTVDASLEVPAPITEAKPYAGSYASDESPLDDPEQVQFCLGVLVPPYDERLVTRGEDGVVGAQGSIDLQQLFCSETVDLG